MFLEQGEIGQRVILGLLELRHLPHGRAAREVMPDHDDVVALDRRPQIDRGLGRRRGERYLDAFAAAGLEFPEVERAADGLPFHLAAIAQMRPQMRAIRVGHHRLAGLGAEDHQLLAEILDPPDVAGLQVPAEGDHEPAGGKAGEREAGRFGHGYLPVVYSI